MTEFRKTGGERMRWEFSETLPIYTQVMERVQRMIVSGALAPGERLPSVRALALEAGVNPNTMQRALAELERSGLIYTQRTVGSFVTGDREIIAKARAALAAVQTRHYLQSMAELGCSAQEIQALLESQQTSEWRNEHVNPEL